MKRIKYESSSIYKVYVTKKECVTDREFKDLEGYFEDGALKLLQDQVCDEYLSQLIYAIGEDAGGRAYITTDEDMDEWILIEEKEKIKEE